MKGWIDNKYKVLKILGEGKDSKVYLCKSLDEDCDTVALKVYKLQEKNNLTELYFQRECDVLTMLNHKNIVNILDKGYCQDKKIYYIALEYLEGTDLNKILKDNTMKSYDKYHIVNQIIDAIEYSHCQNVLHRDLKPSNIMVGIDGNIKIIDFGISKILDAIRTDSDMTIQALTLKYASPEQKEYKELTVASDIYSLGLIIYEILIGTYFSMNNDILREIQLSTKLKLEEKNFLIKMLQKNKDDRYNNVLTLKKEWNKISNKDKKAYFLSLSQNATNKLGDLLFKNNLTQKDAIDFILTDLEEVYIASVNEVYKDNSDNKYILWGKQLEYNCGVEKDTFKIISVASPEIRILEKRKEEYGCKVNENFCFGMGYEKISIKSLLNHYGEFLNKKKFLEEKSKIDIISKWKNILSLQKNLINNNKKTYRYNNLKCEGNSLLVLDLKGEINGIDFTQDQILVLTDVNSSFNLKKAGYFNNFKNGKLYIDMFRGLDPSIFSKSGEVSIDTAYIDTIIRKQEVALKKVINKECVNRNLVDILLSRINPRKTYLDEEVSFKNKNLDQNKKNLIEDALMARDLYLLQGPPGTGKTTFISELVTQQLLKNANSKILVSSQSNVAVNHAMSKIKLDNENINIVRLGREKCINNGMENYTISSQQERLIQEIKSKSEEYFKKVKERNFKNDIVEKHTLIKEILELNDNVVKLNKEIEKDIEFLNNKKQYLDTMMDFSSKLKILKDNFDEILYEDSNIKNNEFIDKYLQVGQDFLNKINNASKLKKDLDYVNEVIDNKKSIYENSQNDFQEKCKQLNVSNIEGVLSYQKTIEPEIAKEKRKIEQFSKFEKLKNEWIKKITNTDELSKVLLEEVEVIGATCIGIANYSTDFDLKFDLVIIDEAGRATIPEILVPMILGKKIILVGDHKQLPPVIERNLVHEAFEKENIKKYELEQSLFEYLQSKLDSDHKGILKEQYRMHPVIADLVGRTFYNNNLISNINVENRLHNYNKFYKYSIVWLDTLKNENRLEEKVGSTKRNRFEAEKIVDLLKDMNKNYQTLNQSKSISIITGYKAQKNLINNLIERIGDDYFNMLQIEVDTVDAFQGRETDIVIYSVVRSNTEGDIGFLKDSRRLNVSLSRAKELLVIVGDSNCISSVDSDFSKVFTFIKNNENCKVEEIL